MNKFGGAINTPLVKGERATEGGEGIYESLHR